MFKLQLPLSSHSRLEKYFALGLKNKVNFYGGFIDENINKKFGKHVRLNARENRCSFTNLKEIKKIEKIIENKGYSFSYVYNSSAKVSNDLLVDEQTSFINNILKPKSVILTDLNFYKNIDKKINIHLSSLLGISNMHSLDFFIDNYNSIDRVIFPREIDFDFVQKVLKERKIDIEIFVKSSWCYHSNICSSHHLEKFDKLCVSETRPENVKGNLNYANLNKLQKAKIHCKVCSIYQLSLSKTSNDIYLKIPGRNFKIEPLLKEAKFTDLVIENYKKVKSQKKFIALNILTHKKIFGKYCDYKKCEFFINSNNNL